MVLHKMNTKQESALASKAWPFIEAQTIIDRLAGKKPEKGYVLFETGYGPSGLPHIGTFGEVARTTMVRKAFELLSDIPTKLIAFSDDMDGLRKVPDNIPNPEMVATHLGKALTSIPDPFGTDDSYGSHMNNELRRFLDQFGFDYEFRSATACYKNGEFDDALLSILKHYDEVMAIMLPTLGEERQQTYSPFLPVCKKTGKVLQAPVVEQNPDAGTIIYKDEDGTLIETPVTGGHCKLQWKADWAMRWAALGVDYEMYGKDLTPSALLSGKICRTIGKPAPLGFSYELFLDEEGKKISKSKGNGISLEDWLSYAPTESLSLYMFQSPRKAKRLYFDVIPRQVDDYLTFVEKYHQEEEPEKRFANPAWHIHNGNPPALELPVSFNLLLNLACACNPEDASVLWGFIARYAPDSSPEAHPLLDQLVHFAVKYYKNFVKPTKQYRSPTAAENAALNELAERLSELSDEISAEDLQTEVFTVGKNHNYENLREWFKSLYEILLGQSQGPRMGSFIKLYGREETIALIGKAVEGKDMAA